VLFFTTTTTVIPASDWDRADTVHFGNANKRVSSRVRHFCALSGAVKIYDYRSHAAPFFDLEDDDDDDALDHVGCAAFQERPSFWSIYST
jgi:hypothetical protein